MVSHFPGVAMLSLCCAVAGRQVFLSAGHDFGRGVQGRGGGVCEAQHFHNRSVKAILKEGGQQRALCLGSAFWPKRNTICCHTPPQSAAILALGLIMKVGLGGHQCHIPQGCRHLDWMENPLHREDDFKE